MALNWWQRIFTQGRRSPSRRRPRFRPQLDQLEERCVPSTDIVWTNKGGFGPGGSGTDSDGFEAYFGQQAETARTIVDTAIANWHAVIQDFGVALVNPNQGFFHLDQFSVEISATDLGPNLRGQSNNSTDLFDKPYQGWVQLDSDGAGGGWFFDNTPGASEEFTKILSRSGAQGSIAGSDFLTTITHELGHVFGINADDNRITDFLTDAGPDPNPPDDPKHPGELYLYTPPGGGFATTAFTTSGGLHVYEGPATPQVPASLLPTAGIDLMNDGRARPGNQRDLISNLDAGILRDVYGYQVPVLPTNIPQLSYLAQLDPGTGTLTVHGDADTANDLITLEQGAGTIDVNVNGENISFDAAHVARIVISENGMPNDGDDIIIVNLTNGNPVPIDTTLFVDGGNGTNELDFFGPPTPANYVLNGFTLTAGAMHIDYGVSNIHQFVVQAPGNGNDMLVQGTALGVQITTLIGGPGIDTFDIEGMVNGTDITAFGEAGGDTFYVSQNMQNLGSMQGKIVLDGGADADQLFVEDQFGFDHNYYLSESVVQTPQLQTLYFQCEQAQLDTSDISGKVLIDGTSPTTPATVNVNSMNTQIEVAHSPGGPGHETVDLVRSLLLVRGIAGGGDVLTLDDIADATGDHVTITGLTVGAGLGDNFFGTGGLLAYTGMSELDLNGGSGGNNILVRSTRTGTPVHILSGQGDDLITIGGSLLRGEVPIPATVKSILSPVFVDGQDGSNTLILNDRDDPSANIVTIRADQVGDDPGDTFFVPDGQLHYLAIRQLYLFAGAAGNQVNVVSTAGPTRDVGIFGGLLDDHITIGGVDPFGHVNVGQIHSHVAVHGQGGADTVSVEDVDAASSTRVTLTANQLGADANDTFFNAGANLTFDGLNALTLDAGMGADTIMIRATPAGAATHINAGGGGDQILVDSNGDQGHGIVDGVAGPLTINGQGGQDTLTLDDFNNAMPKQVSITSLTIGAGLGDQFFGAGSVQYQNLTGLTLHFGQAGNTVFVRDTDKKTPITINGGMNADQFTVGTSTGVVDGIRSLVAINGQGGLDQLLVDDSGNLNDKRLTLAPAHIGQAAADTFFSGAGGVMYVLIPQLTVKTGAGNDMVFVRGTTSGTATTVQTGAGDDTIIVDSNGQAGGGIVDGVLSSLTIDGGTGSNTLTLGDTGSKISKTLTVTATQVGAAKGDQFFGPGGMLTYGNLAVLTINGGKGADTYNVQGQAPGTTLMLNTGSAADTINVFVNAASNYNHLFIDGGKPSGSLGDRIHLVLAGNAQVVKHATGPNNTGYLIVTFANGNVSRIDFTDVETIA